MNDDLRLAADVALFMACVAALVVNAYYLPIWLKVSVGLAVIRVLRLAGWLILCAGFGTVLVTQGFITISPSGAIALCFLAAGEVALMFSRGRQAHI